MYYHIIFCRIDGFNAYIQIFIITQKGKKMSHNNTYTYIIYVWLAWGIIILLLLLLRARDDENTGTRIIVEPIRLYFYNVWTNLYFVVGDGEHYTQIIHRLNWGRIGTYHGNGRTGFRVIDLLLYSSLCTCSSCILLHL